MRSYYFHGGVVDVLHRRHIYMKKFRVPQEEKVDAASLDLAPFNGEIFQIPTFLIGHSGPKTKPLVSKLNATAEIQVLDKSASP
jgi:hypothetical protein